MILLSDADASIAKASRENLREEGGGGGGAVSSTFHSNGAHIRAEMTDNRQEWLEAPLPGGRAGSGS